MKKPEDVLTMIKSTVLKLRDFAIENNIPDDDASIEEKVSYEMLKANANYDSVNDLYIKATDKNMMTNGLYEELYDLIKVANDKSDILIKKLKNQIDGE